MNDSSLNFGMRASVLEEEQDPWRAVGRRGTPFSLEVKRALALGRLFIVPLLAVSLVATFWCLLFQFEVINPMLQVSASAWTALGIVVAILLGLRANYSTERYQSSHRRLSACFTQTAHLAQLLTAQYYRTMKPSATSNRLVSGAAGLVDWPLLEAASSSSTISCRMESRPAIDIMRELHLLLRTLPVALRYFFAASPPPTELSKSQAQASHHVEQFMVHPHYAHALQQQQQPVEQDLLPVPAPDSLLSRLQLTRTLEQELLVFFGQSGSGMIDGFFSLISRRMALLAEKGFFPQSTPQTTTRAFNSMSYELGWVTGIRRTPTPLVYRELVAIILGVYLAFFPLALWSSFKWWTVPVHAIIGSVFAVVLRAATRMRETQMSDDIEQLFIGTDSRKWAEGAQRSVDRSYAFFYAEMDAAKRKLLEQESEQHQ